LSKPLNLSVATRDILNSHGYHHPDCAVASRLSQQNSCKEEVPVLSNYVKVISAPTVLYQYGLDYGKVKARADGGTESSISKRGEKIRVMEGLSRVNAMQQVVG
jgi:hypothetical protein